MPNRPKYLSPPSSLIRRLAFSLGLLVLVSCAQTPQTPAPSPTPAAVVDSIITVHYNERPPYLVTTQTGVTGLTGDPVTLAFEKGRVPYQWQQTPTKRQIYILQQNMGQDCVIAWFKNSERETFAKFTLPIYQDKPQIALARADNDKIPASGKIEDFFTNPLLTLLVKDGYSYGEFIDNKIEQFQPVKLTTTNENDGMLKMIHAGHADYMLVAPEEADGLIQSSEFEVQDFKRIIFSDIIAGENRYILCSLQVDDAVIEQLNQAIRQFVHLDHDE